MRKIFLVLAILLSFAIAGASAALASDSSYRAKPDAGSSTKTTYRTNPNGDCDSNAVIRCGIADASQMNPGYMQNKGAAQIYSFFGISSQDMSTAGSDAINGTVYKDGKVYTGGKLVATNAMTAGRQYMPGSMSVTRGGTTFYVRPPSVSFKQQSLPAYVVMHNNRFAYAVINSCGNPVSATPVAPKQKPKKTVVTTVVKPPQQTQTQTQTQTQSVTVNVPAPVVRTVAAQPVAVTPVVKAESTKAIPNTGPGNIAELSAGAVVAGTLLHYFVLRRLFAKQI